MQVDSQENKTFGNQIYEWLTSRFVYHAVFWILFGGGLLYIDFNQNIVDSTLHTLSTQLINLIFFAIIIYFNLLYLVPNYFKWNKLSHYLMLLVLFVIIITPIKMMVLYLKLHDFPVRQAILIEDKWNVFYMNLIVAGFSTIFKIISDWARHQREKNELGTRAMQSELNFLRTQINPHFLFNTLNNLYALTLKKSDKAPEIVIKLSEMMRYMLYECNEKEVPLVKEVNYIRNYLELEKIRQIKQIDIQLKVNGMVMNQRIAPLMFIPFIENSFKHGLGNHTSEGFIHILLDVKSDSVHLNVSNSKPPTLPVREVKRSGGIGLVNVRRRLDLIYPKHHKLVVSDNPNTYEVDLTIDLGD